MSKRLNLFPNGDIIKKDLEQGEWDAPYKYPTTHSYCVARIMPCNKF